MSEDLKKTPLELRLRSWLVRRICGRHSYDKLTTKVDKVVLHATVETIYQTLSDQTHKMLAKSTAQLPKETLAQCIAANTHLTDLQKTQIANILATSTNIDNSRSYLQ